MAVFDIIGDTLAKRVHPRLSLPLIPALGFLSLGEQLPGYIQHLPLPLVHLNRVDSLVGGDLLYRLRGTDPLLADYGHGLGTVSAAFAHLRDLFIGVLPHFRD